MTSRARREERQQAPAARHINQAWQEAKKSGKPITFGGIAERARALESEAAKARGATK